MKRILFIAVLFCLMGSMKAGVPVPENGFWVIITTEGGVASTTIKYYDLQAHLIYEEHIDGVRLDGRKRRVCRMLNKKLQTVLVSWARNK